MNLFIQIPCYNEEKFLAETINSMPERIPGIDKIEYLVIDDGSSDNTIEVAKKCGVKHILKLPEHLGLARAFISGIEYCLRNNADIIVNTDADNQYCSDDIKKLVKPILENKADFVIGARPIDKIKNFSSIKKILQKFGSMVVRMVSNSRIEDTTSGFRAFSRLAASKINVFSDYTYTIETIIQAGLSGISMLSIPIRVNKQARPSRLIKNIPDYILKSILTIFRIFLYYKPLRFFVIISILFNIPGFALGIRYIYILVKDIPGQHIQSLILAAILIITGFLFFILGLIGDLISVNRRLLMEIKSEQRLSETRVISKRIRQ